MITYVKYIFRLENEIHDNFVKVTENFVQVPNLFFAFICEKYQIFPFYSFFGIMQEIVS